MNWRKSLATLFVMLALSGCASMATDQVQGRSRPVHMTTGRTCAREIWACSRASNRTSRDRCIKARRGALTASSAATCFAERAERGDKPLFR